MANPVYFDDVDLDNLDPALEVVGYEFQNYPSRSITKYKLANQNGSASTSAEYVDKGIQVNLIAKSCTNDDSVRLLNLLKRYTQGFKKELEVTQDSELVSWVSTLESIDHKWVANNLVITLNFYCNEAVGLGPETELIDALDQNNTSSYHEFDVEFEGSSLEQLPHIRVTINSLDVDTDTYVEIGNLDTAQRIRIERVFEAGDVIDIYSDTLEVKVNGADHDFSGAFPEFEPTTGKITWDDNFLLRDIDVEADYRKRYV